MVEMAPGSALAWDIGFDEGTVTLYDQISYTQQVYTEGALVDLGSFPRLDNAVGARVSWEPGQCELQCSYGHDDFIADTTSFDYLDRDSEYLFARAGWRFAEATQAGLEASGTITRYWQPLQRNNNSLTAGGYLEWQATPWLNLDLRGGPSFYWFEAGQYQPSATMDGYYLNFSASHQITQALKHSLSVQRDIQLGVNLGSDYVEEWAATYEASWNLTRTVTLEGSLTGELASQPLQELLSTVTENYNRIGPQASVSWKMTDKIDTSISFSQWLRQSNLPLRGYHEKSVELRFGWQ
jgi:hypothetical protein